FVDSLQEAARLGNDAVLARAQETGERQGPATTLTMMIAIWPNVYLLHIGDSRCYRFREGRLELLTRDQTMAEDLVAAGALPPERAAGSPFARILSSSLGGRTTMPVVTTQTVQWGDIILLCTDGLTKHVTDQEVARRLAELVSSEQACRALVD